MSFQVIFFDNISGINNPKTSPYTILQFSVFTMSPTKTNQKQLLQAYFTQPARFLTVLQNTAYERSDKLQVRASSKLSYRLISYSTTM